LLLGIDRLPDDHFAVFRSLTKYSTVKSEDLSAAFGTQRGRRVASVSEFRKLRRKQKIDNVLLVTREKHKNKISGIPQGSSMSGLLSNIFMVDFDEAIYELVTKYGGRYYRYSDDIAIILPIDVDPRVIDAFVRSESEKKNLEVHGADTDKAATVRFTVNAEGLLMSDVLLNYLGFSFDGQRILLRDKTLARFYRKMSVAVAHEVRRANKYGGRINFGKLQRRFTHLGLQSKRRKFLTYAADAGEVTGSEKLRRQISRAAPILQKKLEKRKQRYKRWRRPVETS
jgi:RNA-directed DNA polymerase